jgi:succinoglycan biosynthesis protein ExoV
VKLHYCAVDGGNFGDDLNLEMWPALFPGLEQQRPDVELYGIGTILGGRDHATQTPKVVLGSGLGYRSTPQLDASWDVRWVRGPHSAELLRLPRDRGLGDGALLWSGLHDVAAGGDRVGLIPHHATWESFDWPAVARAAGLEPINPKLSPDAVVTAMHGCSRILTESLHGAIFADVLGLPWAACVLSHRFNEFKWRDWLAGIDRPFAACVVDRPLVNAIQPGKALKNRLARWSGLGGRGRRNELRAVGAATAADVSAVAQTLAEFARDAAQFGCSERAVVRGQQQRMRAACVEFARDYGLPFAG